MKLSITLVLHHEKVGVPVVGEDLGEAFAKVRVGEFVREPVRTHIVLDVEDSARSALMAAFE